MDDKYKFILNFLVNLMPLIFLVVYLHRQYCRKIKNLNIMTFSEFELVVPAEEFEVFASFYFDALRFDMRLLLYSELSESQKVQIRVHYQQALTMLQTLFSGSKSSKPIQL